MRPTPAGMTMSFPKGVTVAGLVVAISAIFVDPANAPWLTSVFGAAASAKLGAIGALIAALGKGLTAPSSPQAS